MHRVSRRIPLAVCAVLLSYAAAGAQDRVRESAAALVSGTGSAAAFAERAASQLAEQFEAGPDGNIARVTFARMALGEPDESGRRRPVATGEEFTVEADTVVQAIGYGTDDEIVRTSEGIETDQWSQVSVNEDTFETSRAGVFAGGDCVNGADLVVTAVADGRRAAAAIHEYLADLASAAA